MAEKAIPWAAAAFLGMMGIVHWENQPGNLTDKSQVVGSHPSSQATKNPNVLSSTHDPPTISGINSQIPNPRLKAPLVKVPHTKGPTPYAVIMPDSNFHPLGTTAHTNFTEIEENSRQHLKNKPASVPVSIRNLNSGKPLPMVDVRGRSYQYMAAADTDRLASIPISRPSGRPPMHNPINMPANYARAVKSLHYGTLLPGTKPAVYIHPESAHTSTSPWTRIYTGRHTKVTY